MSKIEMPAKHEDPGAPADVVAYLLSKGSKAAMAETLHVERMNLLTAIEAHARSTREMLVAAHQTHGEAQTMSELVAPTGQAARLAGTAGRIGPDVPPAALGGMSEKQRATHAANQFLQAALGNLHALLSRSQELLDLERAAGAAIAKMK